MADLDSFRRETRAWLEANAPKSLFGQGGSELEGTWGGRKATYPNPDTKLWLDRAAARGFTAPTRTPRGSAPGKRPSRTRAPACHGARS